MNPTLWTQIVAGLAGVALLAAGLAALRRPHSAPAAEPPPYSWLPPRDDDPDRLLP